MKRPQIPNSYSYTLSWNFLSLKAFTSIFLNSKGFVEHGPDTMDDTGNTVGNKGELTA
jgi:hypothetical protein